MSYLYPLFIEASLSLKSTFRYKIGILSDFIIFLSIYIIAVFFGSGSSMATSYDTHNIDGRVLILIGVIFWQLSITALGFSSNLITNSYSRGTLELRLQSSVSPILLTFVNVVMSMISSFLICLFVLILALFYFQFSLNDLFTILASFIIVIPSVLGMFGMGLIFGAITLVEKNIGQFLMLYQGILLFASNSIFYIESNIINLIPFPLGTEIARLFYIGEEVPSSSILMYLLINIIWLLIGIFVFNYFLKKQRKAGSFDTY